MSAKEAIGLVLLLVLSLLLIIFGPLAIIWALNTLFPVLAINFSFWTWLAVVVINMAYLGPIGQINTNLKKLIDK